MEVKDPLGQAPKDPHLGLLTGDGTVLAIPKGATIVEIVDPTDPRKVTPLVLAGVQQGMWTFRCRCNERCTAVYKFRAQMTGAHIGNPQRQNRRR